MDLIKNDSGFGFLQKSEHFRLTFIFDNDIIKNKN